MPAISSQPTPLRLVEVEELSGQRVVPVLLTDGEAIVESQAIVKWAKAHPRAARPTS